MRHLPSHRVGRDELVSWTARRASQQSVDLKACNSKAQTRNTRAARRSRRLAPLADLEGRKGRWQKIISLSTRRSCGLLHPSSLVSMRPTAVVEAGCSISSVMLQQQQEVLLRHLIALLL